MGNGLYDFGRNAFLIGDLDWLVDDFRCFFVDESDDAPNLATDEDLADQTAGSRVGTATALDESVVGVDGTADSANTTLTAVNGDISDSIIIYFHTGTEATSTLVCRIDTGTGLPVTPSGDDITIEWNASGIFKL